MVNPAYFQMRINDLRTRNPSYTYGAAWMEVCNELLPELYAELRDSANDPSLPGVDPGLAWGILESKVQAQHAKERENHNAVKAFLNGLNALRHIHGVEVGQIYRKNDGRVYKMDMAVNGATVQVFLDENEWVV